MSVTVSRQSDTDTVSLSKSEVKASLAEAVSLREVRDDCYAH